MINPTEQEIAEALAWAENPQSATWYEQTLAAALSSRDEQIAVLKERVRSAYERRNI